MNIDLRNKVAIVTGSCRGIGKNIALFFAKEGLNVVIADKDAEKFKAVVSELESAGAKGVLAVKTDVTKESSVSEMVKQAVNKFGRIDILVNNVGVTIGAPFLDTTEELVNSLIEPNLKGMIWVSKHAIAQMVKQGGKGKVINIGTSDMVGGGPPGVAVYSASKYGIIGLTKVLAKEFSPNINVNCVAPGYNMWSDRAQEIWSYVGKTWQDSAERDDIAKIKDEKIWMKRFEEPFEVAYLVAFLCSEKADYIQGQVMFVDGMSTE